MVDILKKRKELIIVMSLISLGAVVRILFFNKEGLWYDETLTAFSLRMSYFDMVRERLAAGHSPLYFTIIYPLAKVFGTGEIVVRLPSYLVSILSIYIFYLIAKCLLSDIKFSIIATIFFILSALNVYFAQEARMYSFCVLFVLLSFYFLIRVFGENSLKLWIFYVISTAVSCNLNASTIPLIFAQLAYVLIKREKLLQFILSILAIVILYIPMGFFYLKREGLDFIEWLSPVTLRTFLEIFYGFGFRPLPSIKETWIPQTVITAQEYLSLYFCGALIVWAAVRYFFKFSNKTEYMYKEKDAAVLLTLWFFLPLFIEYIYSVIKQPLLGPKRYIIILSPAFYLLLGMGLNNLHWKKLKNALVIATIVLFTFALFSFYISPKREDWRSSIAFIDDKLKPGEVMFGSISTQTMYKYYGAHEDLVILDIKYLNARGFAKGWILLRNIDYQNYSELIEDLREVRSLLFIDDYKGIKLYHFER